jgi:hypothetical protein
MRFSCLDLHSSIQNYMQMHPVFHASYYFKFECICYEAGGIELEDHVWLFISCYKVVKTHNRSRVLTSQFPIYNLPNYNTGSIQSSSILLTFEQYIWTVKIVLNLNITESIFKVFFLISSIQ